MQQLQEDKLVEMDVVHSSIRITPKGWNRVADIERGAAALLYKQAFVAMWFDGSMDQAWDTGFKPGVEEGTEIKAVRVDLKEHNDKICDVIIAEIRKSSFLVADFTGNRGGVYFEAGFAKGLGIPVIFTCQKGEWEKQLHFDTRQYNHVIWESPEDLKTKLKSRIQATIPMLTLPKGDKK
ncbi:MAG: nucleoside 2-deoxyribosyltransferase [Elusimicrobia bacterium]|nr:nucleoside 2-deoxyribosyltransferase [Elusimicrobiota bacterium]